MVYACKVKQTRTPYTHNTLPDPVLLGMSETALDLGMVQHATLTGRASPSGGSRIHARKGNIVVMRIRILALEFSRDIRKALAVLGEGIIRAYLLEQLQAFTFIVRAAWRGGLGVGSRHHVFFCVGSKKNKYQK